MSTTRRVKVLATASLILAATAAPMRVDVVSSGNACGAGVALRVGSNDALAVECPCGGSCQYVQFFTSCCTANFRCYYPA